MVANSFPTFDINPLITGLELEQVLYNYKREMSKLHSKYSDYFSKLSKLGTTMNLGQKVETLLSIRFALGLALDRIVMGKDEVDVLESLTKKDKETEEQTKKSKVSLQLEDKELNPQKETLRTEGITEEQKEGYNRMYMISTVELNDTIQKIDTARHEYFKDTHEPRDISKMLDVLIEIKYKEKILELAAMLAQTMRDTKRDYTEEQFKEALITSKPYAQLTQLYNEINTQDKRNMLIPEIYVNSNMSNTRELTIGKPERIKQLIQREESYELQHRENYRRVSKDPSLIEKEGIPINQNHDYSWGIVLQQPQYMFYNEPVDTPIFKGHITVERLGAFSELSLFRKKRIEYEIQKNIAQKAEVKKKTDFVSKLKMKKGKADDKSKTMRMHFYRHEASKELMDNLLRVTKVDTDGRISTRIIISPVQYTGNEGSKYREFLKNVYFSDYVLDVATSNGGYAGRVENTPTGFYVSNRYGDEQIASAVLFSSGKTGVILDNRDRRNKVKYSDATKDTLLELLNSRGRERNFNE